MAMFVRWQKRKRQRPKYRAHRGVDYHWRAILAESYTVDGEPRQRHIAYLGGITDSELDTICIRGRFWHTLKFKLDRLAKHIPPAERQRIEAAVAAKVPPISAAEDAECERRRRELRIPALWDSGRR